MEVFKKIKTFLPKNLLFFLDYYFFITGFCLLTFIYPFLSLFSFISSSIFLIANAILIRKIYNKNCARFLVALNILLIPLFIIYPQEYNFIIIIFSALSLTFYYLKDIKMFIYGVQIQSPKSTLFAILFTSLCAFILSLICQEFFSKYFLNFDENNDKNHLSGLGDIMIGIGSALMALSIFVYESIARKRRYFDKYYLTGLTNNIVLTILYFVGLLVLLLIYIFPKIFFINSLEQFLFCYVFLLIILAGFRFFRTAMGLLFRDVGRKIEKEVVESYFENLKSFKRLDLKKNNEEYVFLLEDFLDDTLCKLKESKFSQVEDDWYVIRFYIRKLIEEMQKNKIDIDDLSFLDKFLYNYLHYIPLSTDSITFQALISYPYAIFQIIILEKKFLITKDKSGINKIQNYFYYYQAMYSKGFELNKKLNKLSQNEKYIANILLDRSRITLMEFAKYLLKSDYKYRQISRQYFENYAVEFLIYFYNLAKECFDNNDFNNFEIIVENLFNLFEDDDPPFCVYDGKSGSKLPQYVSENLFGLAWFILYKTNENNLVRNLEFLNKCTDLIFKTYDEKVLFIKFDYNNYCSNSPYWINESKEFIRFNKSQYLEIFNRFFVYQFLILLSKNKSNIDDSLNWILQNSEKNNSIDFFNKISEILKKIRDGIKLYPNFLTANYPDGKVDIIIKLLAKQDILNIDELIKRFEKINHEIIQELPVSFR